LVWVRVMEASSETNAGTSISGNLAVCAFVSSSHLFKKLEKADLDTIYKSAILLKLGPGQVVIKEGAEGRDIFLLMKGNVKVETSTKQGLVELAQLSRGAFFGEVSLLTGRPRTATVTAMDSVEVIVINGDDMEGILRRYPKVRKLMQTVVEGRVRTALEKA
jgi:CRP/FNR family transcriptional regulator, cyclic AMP receptor protein